MSPRVLRGSKVVEDIVTVIPVIFAGKDFGANLEDDFYSVPSNRPATLGPGPCMKVLLAAPW